MKLENGDSIVQAGIVLEHRSNDGALIKSWKFNPKTDEFNVWNTQLLLIQEKNSLMSAKVFDLYTDEVLCDRNLNGIFPRDVVIRGWITKDGVLFSPKPGYMKTTAVTYIPHATKSLFYQVFNSILCWCSKIHVTKEGNHFVMYDFDDDQTVIFSLPDMTLLKSSRCGYTPTGIERVGDKLVCSRVSRFGSKTDTIEVDI